MSMAPVKKPRWQWARVTTNSITPSPPYTADLLANWRLNLGITMNLPEITIWRMHIKISIRITVPTQQANDGIFISSWVDSAFQPTQLSSPNPYDQKYLIWDAQYITEQIKTRES